ncbi:MAG: TonB family protein [Bacteroidetes bacterium]|nr:TonB family protein [Bacteroidota bacterium]
MKKNKSYYPGLDDLAFEGRNKTYGAYYLRKKYLKYGILSLLFAGFIFLLLIIIPFMVYYFKESDISFSDEDLYMVDYTFMPTPEDDVNLAARAMVKPQPEPEEIPIVVDSVQEEMEKKPVKTPPEQTEEKKPKNDSMSSSRGVSGEGQGTADPSGIYTMIDVYPRFPGGDEARLYFLRNNIRYPESAMKNGVQGIIIIVFIIEQDGLISHVEVKKGIGGGCDEEASRVARAMPRWEPGKRSGRPVRVMVQMPIVFKLPTIHLAPK